MQAISSTRAEQPFTNGPAVGTPEESRTIFPVWLRVVHWLNVLAVLVMVTSGWRIYNASPIFGFDFPSDITLGGWLGGALQWHFAGMWLLVVNGAFYLTMNIATGRLRRKFFPLSVRSILADALAAARGKLSHADPRKYNALQRAAYLFVMLDIILLVLTGLAIWKPVQFALLRTLFGGFDFARVVHFFAMAALVAFVLGHVFMVAVVPKTLLHMIRGR